VTYEGTNQVKDTKINILVHDYELFTMLENENISSLYARFNDIINALKEEAKDLSTLPLEDLLGSLMTHELRMSDQARTEPKKTITLKDKKKSMIATWSDSDDSSSDEDENEEIANIAFMAMEDDNEVCSSTLSYNDLQNEYNELID
ncbi:UBN2 domain-containing protein, partial [Cephalotus follicularis]